MADFNGNNDNNTITGTPNNDRIWGRGGNDRLSGLGGADTIRGGTGNDSINGFSGTNSLFGEAGHDSIYGGNDPDLIDGGSGDDDLHGYGGNDRIYAAAGNDFAWGGPGNDLIRLGTGDDWATGEAGDESIFGDDGDDTLYGDDGNDFLHGRNDNDFLYGGAGDDTLFGGPDLGNDVLLGNEGNDVLFGERGSDYLSGYANDRDLTTYTAQVDIISGNSLTLDNSPDGATDYFALGGIPEANQENVYYLDTVDNGNGSPGSPINPSESYALFTDFAVGEDIIHLSDPYQSLSENPSSVAPFITNYSSFNNDNQNVHLDQLTGNISTAGEVDIFRLYVSGTNPIDPSISNIFAASSNSGASLALYDTNGNLVLPTGSAISSSSITPGVYDLTVTSPFLTSYGIELGGVTANINYLYSLGTSSTGGTSVLYKGDLIAELPNIAPDTLDLSNNSQFSISVFI